MFSGIGPGSLLIILLIVVLLFGTKKLRNIGSDLGGAIKSFRKASTDNADEDNSTDKDNKVIENDADDKKD